jgi:hypothetical protein
MQGSELRRHRGIVISNQELKIKEADKICLALGLDDKRDAGH